MKDYLNKWTIPRAIQLAIGLFFLWDYFGDGSRLALAFSLVMLVQAVGNIGCFSSRGCSTNVSSSTSDTIPVLNEIEVEYEEISSL